MIGKRTAYVVLLVLAFHCAGTARQKTYEQGKVIDLAPRYMRPIIDVYPLFPFFRMLIGYDLQIQVGDDTYFVHAGSCCPPSSLRGKFELAVGDQLEFRANKGKLFVRRPGGQEFNARLLKVVTGIARPSLSTLSMGTGPRFSPLDKTSGHETLLLSPDFLRADDMCLILFGNVGAGDFFDHIRGGKTANGVLYRKGSHTIKTFPETLVVSVIAVLGKCSNKPPAAPWDKVASTDIHFDAHFMESITFDGSWKDGLTEKPAELGPLAEGRISNPVYVANEDDFSWEYQFRVKAAGVSINNGLMIVLQSPEGKMIARFSARLAPKI